MMAMQVYKVGNYPEDIERYFSIQDLSIHHLLAP
jgi:hypothetical protein